MKISKNMSDKTLLTELGERLARQRLNQGLSQETLAEEAGVSRMTVHRAEQGKSVQLTKLVRLLRALDLLDNLDAVVPQPGVSPVQLMKMHGKARQRAPRQASKPDKPKENWVAEQGAAHHLDRPAKKPWTWKDTE
ncbi:MAG: helix-turn-helix domain-containing protein [Pseudomonadales bacterium]